MNSAVLYLPSPDPYDVRPALPMTFLGILTSGVFGDIESIEERQRHQVCLRIMRNSYLVRLSVSHFFANQMTRKKNRIATPMVMYTGSCSERAIITADLSCPPIMP